MLAIVTSLLAGAWLGHVVRLGRPLRKDEDDGPEALIRVGATRPPKDAERRAGRP